MRRALAGLVIVGTLASGGSAAASATSVLPRLVVAVSKLSSQLQGISCTSPAACTAVGFAGGFSDSDPLVEFWNGSTWSIQPAASPSGEPSNQLLSVSCVSATECVAVGFSGSDTGGGSLNTLAEVWNGNSWLIESPLNPVGATDSQLLSVSCTSGTNCEAVGYSDEGADDNTLATLVEVWNGSTWSIQASPNVSGVAYTDLEGVSCVSPSDCTAVGGSDDSTTGEALPLAEVWNGSSWSIQPTVNPAGATSSGFSSISCTSAIACTAAGGTDTSTLVEAWNGRKWRIQSTPNPAGSSATFLEAVSCASAKKCTAAGTEDANDIVLTLIEFWNGSRWSIHSTSNRKLTSNWLLGVSCTSSNTSCHAVGFSGQGGDDASTLAEVPNPPRISWKIQPTPNPTSN
jgi:hypothetical protein